MEIHRKYWYTVDGKTYPDESSMVAKLLDENMLFVNGREYVCVDGKKKEETLVLFLNCNDSFVPAADAESLSLEELPKLFSLYEKKGDVCSP